MDSISLERIKLLHPSLRKEVLELYTYINTNILGKGVRLRLAYTLRTNKEQDDLYAIGRTTKGSIVTNAKGGESIHNYGLAFDIVLLIDKNLDGVFEEASWDTVKDFDKDGTSDWMEVVKYLKSKGWEWGGDWKFVDKPHFQKTKYTWKQLKTKVDSKEVVIDNEFKYPKL